MFLGGWRLRAALAVQDVGILLAGGTAEAPLPPRGLLPGHQGSLGIFILSVRR
jgi:hypothetical protein